MPQPPTREKDMKPIIKYRGGKSKEIPYIESYIPRFKGRYIEPFFGGGALYFHLQPRLAIINDINVKLMDFYRGVRDDYDRLSAELKELSRQYELNRAEFVARKRKTPDQRVEDANEELYYRLRAQYNDLEPKQYSRAALYYYINKTSYSGMIRYNSRGEFNVPFGRYPHLGTDCLTKQHSLLLSRALLYNTDYSDIFAMARADDFMFLDPPYDCTFTDYGNSEYKDGFTEQDHRRLAECFYNLPCRAMMVIGLTPLIKELYGSNIACEYDKSYAVNIRNRFKSAARHVIVTNYATDLTDGQRMRHNDAEYSEPEVAQLMLLEKEESYGKD